MSEEVSAAWLDVEEASRIGWRWSDVMRSFAERLEPLEHSDPVRYKWLWRNLRRRDLANIERYQAAQANLQAVAGALVADEGRA